MPGSTPDAIETPHEVWVIDTSAIIEVRRDRVPKAKRPSIWEGLTSMVRAGALVFPREVFDELAREHGTWKDERSDEPYDWAKRTRETATRHGTDYGSVKRVLAKAAAVLDHEKVGGADEADPYVLALALTLKETGHEVTVVTQESRDRPDKMSLSTACGLLRLYSLPLLPFLSDRSIWAQP